MNSDDEYRNVLLVGSENDDQIEPINQQQNDNIQTLYNYGNQDDDKEEQQNRLKKVKLNINYDDMFNDVDFQSYKESRTSDKYNLDKYRQMVCSSEEIKKSIIRELTYSQHSYIDIIRKCQLDFQQQQNNKNKSSYELKITVEQSMNIPATFQNYIFDNYQKDEIYYNPDKLFFTIGREESVGNLQCQYCDKKQHKLILNEVQLKNEVLQLIHIQVDYSQLQIKGNIKRNEQKLQQLFRKNNKSVLSFQSIRNICAKQLDKKGKLRIQDVTQHIQQLLLKISSHETEYQEGSEIKQFDEFQVGSTAIMQIKNTYNSFHLFLEKQDDRKNKQQERLEEFIFRIVRNLTVNVKYISTYTNVDELLQKVFSKQLDLNGFYLKLIETPQLYEQLQMIYSHPTLLVQVKKDTHPIQFFALIGSKEGAKTFYFGRGDLNHIRFDGNQVSRCHGEIRLIGNNQWRIVDGGKAYAQDQWTCSTMGTWKLLKQKTYYHIDNNQLLRYGNQLLRFNLSTNQEQDQNVQQKKFNYKLDDLN